MNTTNTTDRGDYYDATFEQRSAAWDEAEAALETVEGMQDWRSECENTATHEVDMTEDELKERIARARELAYRRAWEGDLTEFAAELGTMQGYLNLYDMGTEYWKREFGM